MGIYFRKSIRVGPLKFNLSKSGIGVSAGIKGLRFVSGPRGNYVHIGSNGIYYKKSFSTTEDTDTHIDKRIFTHDQLDITHAPLEEIESATVFQMKDIGSAELLDELNRKRKKFRFWPIVLSIGLIFSLWLGSLILFVITLFAAIGVYFYDQIRKTTVLFYDLESKVENFYESLIHSIKEMSLCNKTWHIEAKGVVYDKKYHAGADSVIKRALTKITIDNPSFVKTNILVPKIKVGKQEIHFFPDRLLVFENNAVGAVSYKELNIESYTANFIEDERVPEDSKVVGETWRYVNKSGGPDKRFNDNKKIPIVEYGYIHFLSNTGLNELICLSRTDKGEYLRKSVRELIGALYKK